MPVFDLISNEKDPYKKERLISETTVIAEKFLGVNISNSRVLSEYVIYRRLQR